MFSELATSVPLEPTDTEIDGHTLNAEWTINDKMTLHSITAWRELRDKSYIDFASGATEEFRIDFNTAVAAAAKAKGLFAPFDIAMLALSALAPFLAVMALEFPIQEILSQLLKLVGFLP